MEACCEKQSQGTLATAKVLLMQRGSFANCDLGELNHFQDLDFPREARNLVLFCLFVLIKIPWLLNLFFLGGYNQ